MVKFTFKFNGNRRIRWKRLITIYGLLFIITYLLNLHVWLYDFVSELRAEEIIKDHYTIKFGSSNDNTQSSSTLNQNCPLPYLNEWDPKIKDLFNTDFHPLDHCWPTFKQRSFLAKNGRLWIDQMVEGEECWYKCKGALSDHEMWFDEWKEIDGRKGAQPNCDIMDVKCEIKNKQTYKFQHLQIVEKAPTNNFTTSLKNKYNVYIMVIDSTSASHFKRALPLTRRLLLNEMDAVEFEYLNKVGYNSRPNAYAFLMGEQPESLIFNGVESASQHADELCQQPVDNKTILGDFKNKGYRVFYFEDYAQNVFYWPGCKGFMRNEFDHSMRPFVLPIDGPEEQLDPDLKLNLLQGSCRGAHEYVLEATQQFWSKYKEEAKFSLSWMIYLNHNEMDKLFHADKHFFDFFDRNREELSNSFLFLMGDHGNSLDDLIETPQGQKEVNNPMLVMKLPDDLRKNRDLMDQLKRNSRQLVTHYDLYATFRELIEQSNQWTSNTQFSSSQFLSQKKELKGQSLFHELKQPRNCHTLQIPTIYCLCERRYRFVHDPELSQRIALVVVQKMNEDLQKSKFASKCAHLVLDVRETRRMRIQLFDEVEKGKQLMRVELKVKPSGGLYDVFVEYSNNEVRLLSNQFLRHDTYAEQSKCIPPDQFIRNYCLCV